MVVLATAEVVRIMGIWVRRADAGLARGAARNAAASMADDHARRLEETRTLRELQAVLPPEIPPATAVGVPSGSAS
jgi:hypothetical protein